MKKHIVFLMSDTGGGHRAAAEAIAEAIHYLNPDRYKTFLDDIWKDYTPWPFNKLPGTYPWLTGPGIRVWKLMWSVSNRARPDKVVFPTVSPVLKKKVIGYLRQTQPDILVSVHPLMNDIVLRMMRWANLEIPFVTVVTDMVDIHPLWIHPRVTLCMVPTEPARQAALKYNMPAEKLEVVGQPVALKFANGVADKASLREKLGLALDRKAILLVGGGEGFGRIYETARAIASTVSEVQLLVICGRNKALKQQLEQVSWEIPTTVYGFVDNMPELMGSADILVTKAGPGTISEAFVARLPLILFDYIPGQEAGNVTYVLDNQVGAFSQDPQEIASLIIEWVQPGNPILQQMAERARALARPEASLTIARNICTLI
jgi:1,2-diacylglycerol 3-beta-galactosyltransferase